MTTIACAKLADARAGGRDTADLIVAVVEDDVGMRKALARILQFAGFKVEAFASAEACLASGATASADCFVFDVQLPGESGFALRERLEQVGSTAPVIFITAHDSAGARARAAQLRAAAYLPKPFAGRALVDSIRQAVRGR
jgi:FixJ family two-component response regulator